MRPLHVITENYLVALGESGVPVSVTEKLAEIAVKMLEPVERTRRAAALLPKIGAEETAKVEHCCRATVYNRTKRQRRMKIV